MKKRQVHSSAFMGNSLVAEKRQIPQQRFLEEVS
jgi:hypothetical protein